MTPRLKWFRTAPGRYRAGPYRVDRLATHRALWKCERFHEVTERFGWQDLGVFDTAAKAKQKAADDYAATKGAA